MAMLDGVASRSSSKGDTEAQLLLEPWNDAKEQLTSGKGAQVGRWRSPSTRWLAPLARMHEAGV